MSKIFQLPLPSDGVKTLFVCSDVHALFSYKPALDIMFKLASFHKIKPDLLVDGDLADVDYFCAKDELFQTWIQRKDGVDEFFYPKYQEEMVWLNQFFDTAQQLFGRVDYMLGNHENRWNTILHSLAHHSHHLFNYRQDLKLASRGIECYPYNSWLDFGPHLTFTHGFTCSSTALKKHYELSGGKSVVYGHVHDYGVKSFSARGQTKQSISLPCMSILDPRYLKGNENNWSHGFMVINMMPNGIFYWNVFQIWEDRLVLPSGKIILP